MSVGKFRNEDLSVYFFIKNIVVDNNRTIGDVVKKIYDGYPYNDVEQGLLETPAISIEATQSIDDGGELGASWVRRSWDIDFFATTDTQRDEVADRIFQALDVAIPIKDFSGGFRKETGKSLIGTDLRVIEHVNPESRRIKPAYGFNFYQKVKYWRVTVSFETVSTQAS